MKGIVFGGDGTILDTQNAKTTIFSQYLHELFQAHPQDKIEFVNQKLIY